MQALGKHIVAGGSRVPVHAEERMAKQARRGARNRPEKVRSIHRKAG
jgi:hypothetical protein